MVMIYRHEHIRPFGGHTLDLMIRNPSKRVKSAGWRFDCGPIFARDGMLAG